jgi:phycobilisome rod-core linker protein
MSAAWAGGQPPAFAQKAWLALAAIGGLEVLRVILTSAGSMLSTGAAG